MLKAKHSGSPEAVRCHLFFSSAGIGGAFPFLPFPGPFRSVAPCCCGFPPEGPYGLVRCAAGCALACRASETRCRAMVGSLLSSNSLIPNGKLPSGACLTDPMLDANLVNAALSQSITWCKEGLQYPGGGSLCMAWIKKFVQVLCCSKVISRANLNATPRLVMAKRNCISLEVGATNLSSLSLMTSAPPSKLNFLHLLTA